MIAAAAVLLSACKQGGAGHTAVEGGEGISQPRYATGFSVSYTADGCLLDIQDPLREHAEQFNFFSCLAAAKASRHLKAIR